MDIISKINGLAILVLFFSNLNVCQKIISSSFGAFETCRKSAITFEEW